MSLLDKIKTQIQNLIGIANEKTGNADTDLTSAVNALVGGYGQSGGLQVIEFAQSWFDLFLNVTFEENAEINILSKVAISNNMSGMFRQAKNVKKIKLSAADFSTTNPIIANYMFTGSQSVEVIDISGLKFQIGNAESVFQSCDSLKKIIGIIDFSKALKISNMFFGLVRLEEVRFEKETLSLSVSFAQSPLLSDVSIQSIIDGLATVETAQTLTLHADVKAKLTEAQISQITSKNWTLA